MQANLDGKQEEENENVYFLWNWSAQERVQWNRKHNIIFNK